jgi:hypothetical protein
MEMTIEELRQSFKQLNGLPISAVWQGYGSALFLELGDLEDVEDSDHSQGQASVILEWDWRIEDGKNIVCGSSNSAPEIETGIECLIGQSINSINVEGRIPELVIKFSNGLRLQSMAMVAGNPQWCVRQMDDTFLSWENGSAVCREEDDETDELPIEEQQVIDFADSIAERWGVPKSSETAGHCKDCRFFITIDGEYALLKYGVCTNKDSGYDGKVVNVESGCAEYKEELGD